MVVELESMRVDEQHRDNQVGARLVNDFLTWGRDRGANRASVSAYATNTGAIRFYKAHGFTPFHVELERDL